MENSSLHVKQSVPLEVKEIYSHYDEAFQFLQAKKTRQVNQLILLNNLQRGDENISSTLLLTQFNRMVSNLYDDKMQVKFTPAEEMDQKKVNALNILAQNDYREMRMDKLGYDWIWDTLFFGRGYIETLNFDQARKLMKPSVINPLVFGYDPFFSEVQDWRYYWKWILKSKWEIEKLIREGKITSISSSREIPSGVDPYLWDYKVRKEQARGANPQANDTYQGDVHQILEYYGYDNDGDRSVYWLDSNFSKILYQEKLDLRDGDDGKSSRWPIVVKQAFREPHSSIDFSVADLLDDKHRARSVLLNLAFIAAKDKANPLYQYVPEKVVNVSQLFSRQIYQHIPVTDTTNAIAPLNTQNPMDNGLAVFLQILSQEANDPIGTGMALAPAKKGKQSATETAIQQQLNDLAQSLQSKVLQFGEEQFWIDWYSRYKRYSKDGDEKIATVVGAKGVTFEKIDLGDIHTKYPPGVAIFSAKEAEYKELVLRRDLAQLRPQIAEAAGPDGIRLFDKHVLLPKFLNDPTLIDLVYPKAIDEIRAEEENDALNENSMPDVKETDDHIQHLAVHRMAKNTWAKWVHIHWHKELLGMQKLQKMQAEQQQMQPQPDQGQQEQKPGQPKIGEQKKNPQEAAAPLKQEIAANSKK